MRLVWVHLDRGICAAAELAISWRPHPLSMSVPDSSCRRVCKVGGLPVSPSNVRTAGGFGMREA